MLEIYISCIVKFSMTDVISDFKYLVTLSVWTRRWSHMVERKTISQGQYYMLPANTPNSNYKQSPQITKEKALSPYW